MKWNFTHRMVVFFMMMLLTVGYLYLSNKQPGTDRVPTLIILKDSIDPLKIHFNQARGNVRFISILSST